MFPKHNQSRQVWIYDPFIALKALSFHLMPLYLDPISFGGAAINMTISCTDYIQSVVLPVGIWYLIWRNIGICKAENEEEVVTTTQCNNPPSGDGDDYGESNVVVHADCHAANKGLFLGLVVLVITLVSCILFFICVYLAWVY